MSSVNDNNHRFAKYYNRRMKGTPAYKFGNYLALGLLGTSTVIGICVGTIFMKGCDSTGRSLEYNNQLDWTNLRSGDFKSSDISVTTSDDLKRFRKKIDDFVR